MKAAVVYGANRVEIRDVSAPMVSQEGDVLADVQYVGICKTDEQLTAVGLASERILGHEVVCTLREEQYCYALNNEVPCGQCTYCLEGLTSHCDSLQEIGINCDGGYAQQICAPRNSLYPFEFQNPALGVLIEPLSCALRGVTRIRKALRLLPISKPDILILGGGVSGSLIAYLLSHSLDSIGSIRLYDISESSLKWTNHLPIDRVREPEPDRAHIVIECSGSQDGLETAMRVVRKAGIVCLYGVPKPETSFPISSHELFLREITVLTSFAGATEKTINSAIAYIKRDESFFSSLMGRMIPLEDLPSELISWNPRPGTRSVVDMQI
jgi:L-iditol 2-dehydrogenase